MPALRPSARLVWGVLCIAAVVGAALLHWWSQERPSGVRHLPALLATHEGDLAEVFAPDVEPGEIQCIGPCTNIEIRYWWRVLANDLARYADALDDSFSIVLAHDLLLHGVQVGGTNWDGGVALQTRGRSASLNLPPANVRWLLHHELASAVVLRSLMATPVLADLKSRWEAIVDAAGQEYADGGLAAVQDGRGLWDGASSRDIHMRDDLWSVGFVTSYAQAAWSEDVCESMAFVMTATPNQWKVSRRHELLRRKLDLCEEAARAAGVHLPTR